VPRSSDYNVGTELILLSVRSFVVFSDGAQVQIFRLECFLTHWKVLNEAILKTKGKRRSGRHSKPV
jgi:hypothetical protein